jgi:hypothetical protein
MTSESPSQSIITQMDAEVTAGAVPPPTAKQKQDNDVAALGGSSPPAISEPDRKETLVQSERDGAPQLANPASAQSVEIKIKDSNLDQNIFTGIANYVSFSRSTADRIALIAHPYAEEVSDPSFCRNIQSRLFHGAVSPTGLIVVEYPDDEGSEVFAAAIMASLRESHPLASVGALSMLVTVEDAQEDWTPHVVQKIIAEMKNNARTALIRPTGNSRFPAALRQAYRSIRQLDQHLKQAQKLLIVLVEYGADDRAIVARDRDSVAGATSRHWFVVQPQTALAALFDRPESWINEVEDLVGKNAPNPLTYAQLKTQCEAALKFDDLGQFDQSLRSKGERASSTFKQTLRETHEYKPDATFDLVNMFLAAYLPGLGLSHFEKLAQRAVDSLPRAPIAGDGRTLSWPPWTRRTLTRLQDAQLVELKPGSDGTRRVFCASPAVAAAFQQEFERDYILLTELRRDLLSDVFFAEGALSTEQIASWVRLVAQSQRDDPGTEAVRRLAETFRSLEPRRIPLREAGRTGAVAITTFWSASSGEDGRLASAFVNALIAGGSAEVAFQAVRFCCRDSANPIPSKTLLSWILRILRSESKPAETLVYAFVRDVSTLPEADRRDVFMNTILDWILNESESHDLRKLLRDSLANAVWHALVTSGAEPDEPLKIVELPSVGGLPQATALRLLTCLSEETEVRIIDSNVRRAFGLGHETDWLRLQSGFILAFLFAEWRGRLVGNSLEDAQEGQSWLKSLIGTLKEERDRRRLLQRYLAFVIDSVRQVKDQNAARDSRRKYVRLLTHLIWVRAELRSDAPIP